MNLTKQARLILVVWTICFLSLPISKAQNTTEEPRTVKMTIYPAGEPSPALKYSLLPEFLERKPGNALLHYYLALQSMPPGEQVAEFLDVADEWEMQLPQKEAIENLTNSINKYNQAFEHMAAGALRERCDWELPIREPGIFEMTIPTLSRFRTLSSRLATRVKLQAFNQDYEAALESLQTGLSYAQHMSQGRTLIHDLVGHGIAGIMLQSTEQFVQGPEAPNLYWALSGLPRPFIDIRYAIGVERVLLQIEFLELRNIESLNLTNQQILDIYKQLFAFSNLSEQQIVLYQKQFETIKESKVYLEAKKNLIEQGFAEENVESMEALQIVFKYQFTEYVNMRDEMFKWFNMPFWQARDHLKEMEQELEEKLKHEEDFWSNSFYKLLPALGRAYFFMAKLDRHISMLRCVEAVRMYAADHEGQAPNALSDIMAVPIPIDPVTGEEFVYKVEGNLVIIEGPAPAGEEVEEGFRYEITIKSNFPKTLN